MINTVPAIGTIFGSGLGGSLMGRGRAMAFVVACCTGIVGSLITFWLNFYVFLFAKFIVGASIGMLGVVIARFIEEFVPLKWFGISQAIALASLQTGIFLSTIAGAALPPDADKEALKDTKSWIFIFALQPILLIIAIILFLSLVRYDTPRFYIMNK